MYPSCGREIRQFPSEFLQEDKAFDSGWKQKHLDTMTGALQLCEQKRRRYSMSTLIRTSSSLVTMAAGDSYYGIIRGEVRKSGVSLSLSLSLCCLLKLALRGRRSGGKTETERAHENQSVERLVIVEMTDGL